MFLYTISDKFVIYQSDEPLWFFCGKKPVPIQKENLDKNWFTAPNHLKYSYRFFKLKGIKNGGKQSEFFNMILEKLSKNSVL